MRSLLHAWACAACILLLFSSGAMAALPDEENEAVASQTEATTGALEAGTSVAPSSPRAARKETKYPKAERSRKAPAKGQKAGAKDTKNGGKSPLEVTSSTVREYKVKGQTVTIHPDADTGVEYYCRKIRKRLWVDGEGWVIRSMPSCF